MRPLVIALGLWLAAAAAPGDDWPQWRGPRRDGTSAENGLLGRWPAGGPPRLWAVDSLGPGYSGPAVVGDRVFVMGSDGASEYLAALDVESGRRVWRLDLGPVFKNGWGDGPRGTPAVAGDRVVALGAQGVLVCAAAGTGAERWRTDLRTDHAGKLMRGNVLDVDWGYSESPLVDGGRVVVSPGGPKGTVAAFDLGTGRPVWRTAGVADAAGYSSAVVAEFDGVRQYVQLTGGVEYATGAVMKSPPRAVGLDPATGAVLWQHRINYTTAGVINTPAVLGDVVYATCGYGAGCTMLRVAKAGAGWAATDVTTKDGRRALAVYHGGVVPGAGCVFGYSDTAGWVCQAVPDGTPRWADRRAVKGGSVVRVGPRLVVVTVDGTVALTEPGDDGWRVSGAFALPTVSAVRRANAQVQVCSHPVVANGRLYVRDQELLYCFDLRDGRRPPR